MRVVVTGGFGNLGQAVAEALRARGDQVALLDLAAEVPPTVRAAFGPPNLLCPAVDLTSTVSTAAALEIILRDWGGIDALVNVAGGFRWELVASGDAATWDALYTMNIKTAVVATRAALPALLAAASGAAIVNVGAGAALAPASAGMGAYLASKAGVQRLTESLSDELKGKGVRVNAVLPGTMDTPQNRADMPDADPASFVKLAAVADVVAFLLSEGARGVSGAAIPVMRAG